MLSVAPPDAAEIRCNAVFEALLWAMSRPGEAQLLPAPGMAGIIETLIDLECTAYAEGEELRARLAATGALLTEDIGQAGYVFVDSLMDFEAWLPAVNRGSALYPDAGATLVAAASHGRGSRQRLTGPGIAENRDILVDVPAGFWDLRAQLSAYPEGFDLILVDGASAIAIPRSTHVEVL